MISNFTAARRAIYSQRSASRSDTRAWRGADVRFPLPSCFPIGRMRCEPSAAGLGTSRWMCVLGAQRPLAAVAHVASEWPPDGRPRRRDGSFCGAGMPRAYVGRGWCSGRDRTVAYTSYNAHLRGCPRLPGARVWTGHGCFSSLLTYPELKGRRLLPSAEILQVSAGVGGLARAGASAH